MQLLTELARFEIPDVLRFDAGPSGLVRARVSAADAAAVLYFNGAHLAEYQPVGEDDVLFTSGKSAYEVGKPIRGGVPIIFPWFGPRKDHPEHPMHGFARTKVWTLREAGQDPDGTVVLIFTLHDDEQTRALWPHSFELRYTVRIGQVLQLSLEVKNTSDAPFSFEEALHTYFFVDSVQDVTVTGLDGAEYYDKTDGLKRKTETDPVKIAAETDRLYVNTKSACVLDDPGFERQIVVEKAGSDSTVVWNPWIAKAAAMPDFGDEEWPSMLCIETVNAADNTLSLDPGATHRMDVTIRVERK